VVEDYEEPRYIRPKRRVSKKQEHMEDEIEVFRRKFLDVKFTLPEVNQTPKNPKPQPR
jgi:hypothetical protein